MYVQNVYLVKFSNQEQPFASHVHLVKLLLALLLLVLHVPLVLIKIKALRLHTIAKRKAATRSVRGQLLRKLIFCTLVASSVAQRSNTEYCAHNNDNSAGTDGPIGYKRAYNIVANYNDQTW